MAIFKKEMAVSKASFFCWYPMFRKKWKFVILYNMGPKSWGGIKWSIFDAKVYGDFEGISLLLHPGIH